MPSSRQPTETSPETDHHRDPYTGSRIKRGVVYLVGGKAVVSIAGIGAFVLLARSLPIEQFAAYTVLSAMPDLVAAITGVGLIHVLSRYVPELNAQHRLRALRRLVAVVLALRMAVLAPFLAATFVLAPAIAPLIGLAGWEWAIQVYAVVVLTRISVMSLFSVLESLLRQGYAQLGFGLATVLRFLLFLLLAQSGEVDLRTVIIVELAADVVGLGVMSIGLLRALSHHAHERVNDKGWLHANLGRMTEFGLKGYLQHILILPFGGATNRVLVGGALTGSEVALFGFAQSVGELMERYLPAHLLAGVIRPVLAARYVRDRRFADVEVAANLIFKLNAVLICAASVVVFGGDEELLMLVSDGKYVDGVGLLLVMCLLVLMFSLRHMLDHVAHAVERNGPLIWSNIVISLSMLPGLALMPSLGVFALPVANVVGVAAGCVILVWRLRAEGFEYRQDIAGLIRLLTATAFAYVACQSARWIGVNWVVATGAGLVVMAVATWALRPLESAEAILIRQMLQRSQPAAAT